MWYHRGQVFCNNRKFDKAVVCYDKALNHSPENAILWRRKGFALIKTGRYDEAVACFDRAIALDPRDATAWQRKGYALAYLGEHEEAVACFDRALALDPTHILAWQCRGWLLGLMRRYDEAVDCYDAILAIDPDRRSAAWYRERMQELRDLAALAAEIREAEEIIEVPACIREVVAEQDYGNTRLARAVLREMIGRAEETATVHRPHLG